MNLKLLQSGIWIGLFLSTVVFGTPPKPLRVIALADLHGALEGQKSTKNGTEVTFGGAALLSSYVEILKSAATAAQGNSIPAVIIDAGDLFQGTLVSNSAEGKPVIAFYNYLAVDAAAIGNHDFDFGPTGPDSVPIHPGEDPVGALKDRMAQARFPFLSANIFEGDGTRPSWAKPSAMIKRDGLKIGVIGFSTQETPVMTNRKNIAGLAFDDPVPSIIDEAKRLRSQGADYVILVGHAGGFCTNNAPDHITDLGTCSKDELFNILDRLPAGTIDVAVGGHTHAGIAKIYKGVPVLEAFSHGQAVGWVTIGDRSPPVPQLVEVCSAGALQGNQVSCNSDYLKTAKSIVPATFLGNEIKPDDAVTKLLQGDFDRVSALKARPLGVTTQGVFERAYYDENSLGNLFVAVLYGTFKDQVDTVLMNNGGLRADIGQKALTYNDVFEAMPFDNILAVLELPGDQLLKILEIGVARMDGGQSWFGISFHADRCKILSASLNGIPIDPAHKYRVLTSDFLVLGGAHLDLAKIKPEQYQMLDTLPNMREELVGALSSYKEPLVPVNFFDPRKPSQVIDHICGTE